MRRAPLTRTGPLQFQHTVCLTSFQVILLLLLDFLVVRKGRIKSLSGSAHHEVTSTSCLSFDYKVNCSEFAIKCLALALHLIRTQEHASNSSEKKKKNQTERFYRRVHR